MARKWEIDFKPRPDLKEGRFYIGKIISVKKNQSPPGILIFFQHLEGEQAGRKQDVLIPIEPYVDGLTAGFFEACDLGVKLGIKLAPKDTEGSIIKICFGVDSDGYYQPTAFKTAKTKEETKS